VVQFLRKNWYYHQLNCSHESISWEVATEVAQLLQKPNNSQISRLVFHNCSITDDIFKLIVQNCKQKLTIIKLNSNNIRAEGILTLTNLNHFHALQYFDLGWNPLRDEGVLVLAKALKKGMFIKYLALEKCGISNQGAEALANCCIQNQSIGSLHLALNEIADRGAIELAKALPYLKTLSLSNNFIAGTGARELARALQSSPHLVALDLFGNQEIPSCIGESFAQGVRHHPSLKRLSLWSTQIEVRTRIEIMHYVSLLNSKKIRLLSYLLFCQNNSSLFGGLPLDLMKILAKMLFANPTDAIK